MAKTRGTGLLMAWTDIDAEYDAEFNAWYDAEHVPRLAAIPGFLQGARYVALKGGPRYLAMYELEDHNVLKSAAFLDTVRYQPSSGRQRISGGHIGRNYILNAYRQIFPTRTQPIEATRDPAPFLQIGRMSIPAAFEDEWNAWYNTAYIPPYLKVPGVVSARRYAAVECEPRYMTVYELADPNVAETPAWNAAQFSNPWTARIRPMMRHDDGSPGVFKRIWPSPA
ncbi:MAG: DUF4286 family protein [Hyphomicrobiaceae bacterium]|nr:DUF4286 family protein [Hyphomicrobiaceae bacterium]